MTPDIPAFLMDLEDRFNQAMVSNDPAQIAACVAEDWVVVTPERGPIKGAEMLALIASGALTHSVMTSTASHAAVQGDMAVVTARAQNTGRYHGQDFTTDEWVTDVYRRTDAGWKCILTHLTPASA
ncbi:nuclear transport factor 2 family protein [Humitalea sp. 24SJ18S-53]|uniref:nuclear transport factor 2 family protein n=1 Tax=Humitalea sp. 24SJ18S-53 TaxID=3422307 RepID=UPI003D6771B5